MQDGKKELMGNSPWYSTEVDTRRVERRAENLNGIIPGFVSGPVPV